MMNTLFFVIGVGAAFFILGWGFPRWEHFLGTARCCLCGWRRAHHSLWTVPAWGIWLVRFSGAGEKASL